MLCAFTLLIGVLAFSIRLFSVIKYDSVIHEIDPYLNYRVTQVKVKSSVRDIISDELEKLKNYEDGKEDQEADMIWEYQGPQAAKPDETENEDILLEMERLLYEDLREEFIQKGTQSVLDIYGTISSLKIRTMSV